MHRNRTRRRAGASPSPRTRWEEPHPQQLHHPWQPYYPLLHFPNKTWTPRANSEYPNNATTSNTPFPTGAEVVVPASAEDQPKNVSWKQTVEGSRPPQDDRLWRKPNCIELSDKRHPSSFNQRAFFNRNRSNRGHRPPRGRRQPFPQEIIPLLNQFRGDERVFQVDSHVDSHVVPSCDNIEPDKLVEETPPPKTDEEKRPPLGSNEEREKTVKEKADWLKNQLKNKDLSDVEKRLQQMRQRRNSEQPLPKEAVEKTLYIPASTDNSALEADSLETVKRNLSADVLPDETNLLNRLLKEIEVIGPISRCKDRNRERVHMDERSRPSDLLALSVRPLKKPGTKCGLNVVKKQRPPRGKNQCFVMLEKLNLPGYSRKETVPSHSSPTNRLNLDLTQNASTETVPSHSLPSNRLNSDLTQNASTGTVPSHSLPTNRLNSDLTQNASTETVPSRSLPSNRLNSDFSQNASTGTVPSRSLPTNRLNSDLTQNASTGTVPSRSLPTNRLNSDLTQNASTKTVPSRSLPTNRLNSDFSQNASTGTVPSRSLPTNRLNSDFSQNASTGTVPSRSLPTNRLNSDLTQNASTETVPSRSLPTNRLNSDLTQNASTETVPSRSLPSNRLNSDHSQNVSKETAPSHCSATNRVNSEYFRRAIRETVPSHSSMSVRPNLTVSRSKTSEGLPNQEKNKEKKKENLLECVSKLAGIPKMKDMTQLKSLIENPRPGKFEYYLKEQIKKYRLASYRAVRLSGEPFTNTENVDRPIKVEDTSEEYLLSSLGKWSESINMEDLPFAIVQELGELLDLEFPGQADGGEEALPAEVTDHVSEELPTPEAEPLATEQTMPARPEIRIKDFARFRTPAPVSLQKDDNANVRRRESQEPDTTVAPASSHPLEGPSLMASVLAVADRITADSFLDSSSTPVNNFPIPLPPKGNFPSSVPQRGTASARGRRVMNTLPQNVFYSAEACEKNKKKSKKKSDEIVLPLVDAEVNSNPKSASKPGRKGRASKSPDSTNLLESEQEGSQSGRMPQSERERSQVSKKKNVANNSMSDWTDEEDRSYMKCREDADEVEIFSRLKEICLEIKKLEKEKAYLYSLLPLPLRSENVKRKRDELSSDESSEGAEELRRIVAKAVATYQQSEKTGKDTGGPSTSKKRVRKRPAKKASFIVASEKRVEPRQEIAAGPSRVFMPVAKGTLAFFMSDITLTCSKSMLPEDMGIITQIKVIRKSILVASANGKIYLINSSTGKLKKTFDLGVFAVKCFCLAQSKDGGGVLLLGGTEDGRLHCFKFLSGEKIHECKISDNINCMDGRAYGGQWKIFIGSKSGSISMYNVSSGEVESLTCENGSIYGITCSNEGARQIVICASSKNGIEVRDANTALMTRRIVTFGESETFGAAEYRVAIDVNINKVCYSKIGEVHITEFVSPGNTVRHKISTHVSCMHLYRGVLYVGCKDGTIRRIDVRTNKVLEPLTGNRENVVCMDIVGNKIILARKGGVLDIIDLNKNTQGEDSVEEILL